MRLGGIENPRRRLRPKINSNRVKARCRRDFESQFFQTGGENFRQRVNPLRDLLQTFRAVINGIHGRHVGEQRLRRADVAGGLFAADVLLARTEREAQRGFAAGIFRHADEASRHLTFKIVSRRDERRMRAAVAHRHAETLCTADGDVRAKFARRLDEREREQIRGHGEQRAGSMGLFRKAGVIMNRAEGVGILHQGTEYLVGEVKIFGVADNDLDAQAPGHAHGRLRCFADGRFPKQKKRSGRPQAGGTSSSPRRRRWLHRAVTHWRCRDR